MTELHADCGRCVGLCCVAATFSAGADFPIDKPAGQACPNLDADHRCGVHARLRPLGFHGCAAFDCNGAGQRLTETWGARADWRARPEEAPALFAAFTRLRSLHGLLWHLDHARRRAPGPKLTALTAEVEAAAAHPDGRPLLPLLKAVGLELRAWSAGVRGPRGRDLAQAFRPGAILRGADLQRADLFGAVLIGADLRGADLRGADLRDADLRGVLFLQDAQRAAARLGPGTRVDGGPNPPG